MGGYSGVVKREKNGGEDSLIGMSLARDVKPIESKILFSGHVAGSERTRKNSTN